MTTQREELENLLVNLDASNVDLLVDAIERMIDERVATAMRFHLERHHANSPEVLLSKKGYS